MKYNMWGRSRISDHDWSGGNLMGFFHVEFRSCPVPVVLKSEVISKM